MLNVRTLFIRTSIKRTQIKLIFVKIKSRFLKLMLRDGDRPKASVSDKFRMNPLKGPQVLMDSKARRKWINLRISFKSIDSNINLRFDVDYHSLWPSLSGAVTMDIHPTIKRIELYCVTATDFEKLTANLRIKHAQQVVYLVAAIPHNLCWTFSILLITPSRINDLRMPWSSQGSHFIAKNT